MFIPDEPETGSRRFTCRHRSESPQEAEALAARYHALIRQFHFFADLYQEGDQVILEAPDEEMLLKMAKTLNYLLEHPDP